VEVNDEMLNVAIRKAVEAGLLPRDACRDNRLGYRELVRAVLQSALDAREKVKPVQARTRTTQTETHADELRDKAQRKERPGMRLV